MALFDTLLTPVLSIIDKIIPDPAAKAAAQLELLKLQQSGELAQLASDTQLNQGQIDINKVEAANPNVFVSGWRPACGWLCVAAMGGKYLAGPLIFLVAQFWDKTVILPSIDSADMMYLLGALLGLGGLRSLDKRSGTTK